MTHISSISLVCLGLVVLALPNGALAKPKKKVTNTTQNSQPAPPPRLPGYAVIGLDSGRRDKLRVAEGEARATLPSIMANDVDLITVVGAYTIVTVYQNPNFRGHSLTLRCGNYELVEQPRNDIESIRVTAAKTPVSECQGSDMELVQYKSWDR